MAESGGETEVIGKEGMVALDAEDGAELMLEEDPSPCTYLRAFSCVDGTPGATWVTKKRLLSIEGAGNGVYKLGGSGSSGACVTFGDCRACLPQGISPYEGPLTFFELGCNACLEDPGGEYPPPISQGNPCDCFAAIGQPAVVTARFTLERIRAGEPTRTCTYVGLPTEWNVPLCYAGTRFNRHIPCICQATGAMIGVLLHLEEPAPVPGGGPGASGVCHWVLSFGTWCPVIRREGSTPVGNYPDVSCLLPFGVTWNITNISVG